jgi:hypothetical protein
MGARATTREQQRAICPACFRQQAVNARGLMAAHGYTRPQHWHQNVRECAGTGRPHFGTEAGRDFTRSIGTGLIDNAARLDEQAGRVDAGDLAVTVFHRVRRNGRFVSEPIAEPTAAQRAQFAASLRAEANGCRAAAPEFAAAADKWIAAAPVVVVVEAARGPLLHWRGGHWRQGKACAGSAMGALQGHTTSDAAHVTCEKCRAIMARHAAKAAQQ